jgi:LysR family transcriptional regulator, nitrogen assimilation regulatory protein
MELRQLRYFLTIAREGTYGRASQVLHVAQPALSRQIQKLEQELGARLFIRHAHGVSITPAGMSIQTRAEHILDEIGAVSRIVRGSRESMNGSIKIGTSPGTAEILAYPLSQIIAERFPDFRCELVSMLMPARTELLRERKVAFALMNSPQSMEGLRTIPLMREPLCLLCRADDDRFQAEALDLSDLADIPLVIGGSGVRAIIGGAFAAAGLRLRTAAEVNTAGASKALVIEGVGPTVHVAVMARNELRRGELRAIPIRGLYSVRVLAIPSEAEITTPIREMMDTMRDCLSDLVSKGKWINAEMIFH